MKRLKVTVGLHPWEVQQTAMGIEFCLGTKMCINVLFIELPHEEGYMLPQSAESKLIGGDVN